MAQCLGISSVANAAEARSKRFNVGRFNVTAASSAEIATGDTTKNTRAKRIGEITTMPKSGHMHFSGMPALAVKRQGAFSLQSITDKTMVTWTTELAHAFIACSKTPLGTRCFV